MTWSTHDLTAASTRFQAQRALSPITRRVFSSTAQSRRIGRTIDAFREKYEHPLWKTTGEMARKMGGHGGMDYVMNYPADGLPEKRSRARYQCLRCRRMECAYSVE